MKIKVGHLIASSSCAVLWLTWDLLREASWGNKNFTIWLTYHPFESLVSCLIHLLPKMHLILGFYLHQGLYLALDLHQDSVIYAFSLTRQPYCHGWPSGFHHWLSMFNRLNLIYSVILDSYWNWVCIWPCSVFSMFHHEAISWPSLHYQLHNSISLVSKQYPLYSLESRTVSLYNTHDGDMYNLKSTTKKKEIPRRIPWAYHHSIHYYCNHWPS